MIFKLFIGIIFLAPFFSLHSHTQLQSLMPATGWYKYSNTNIPTKKDWVDSFVKDCAKLKYQNNHIQLHVTKNNIVRIASYNIHFWCKPGVSPFNYATGTNRHTDQDIESNFDNVISVLKSINADVICLQEVLMFNASLIKNSLKQLGYEYLFFFLEADWSEPFGIVIASKYPFLEEPQGMTFEVDREVGAHPLEKHCFLKAGIQ